MKKRASPVAGELNSYSNSKIRVMGAELLEKVKNRQEANELREFMAVCEHQLSLRDDRVEVLEHKLRTIKETLATLTDGQRDLVRRKSEDREREMRFLSAVTAAMAARIEELEDRLAVPKANPTNSGVPPSQDPFTRAHGDGGEDPDAADEITSARRGPGKKPGDPGFNRDKFGRDEATVEILDEDEKDECPCSGGSLERAPEKDRETNFYRLPHLSAEKVIELNRAFWCPLYRKYHYFGRPRGGYRGGHLDIETIVLALVMLADVHATRRGSLRFLLSMLDIRVCVATLTKTLFQAAAALRPACPGTPRRGEDQEVRLRRRHQPRCRGKPELRLGIRRGRHSCLRCRRPLRRDAPKGSGARLRGLPVDGLLHLQPQFRQGQASDHPPSTAWRTTSGTSSVWRTSVSRSTPTCACTAKAA
jgi:hypothetical protein